MGYLWSYMALASLFQRQNGIGIFVSRLKCRYNCAKYYMTSASLLEDISGSGYFMYRRIQKGYLWSYMASVSLFQRQNGIGILAQALKLSIVMCQVLYDVCIPHGEDFRNTIL